MNNPNNIHENWAKLRALTKYGMTFIALLMTLHCGLLYIGHDVVVVHLLFTLFVMLTGLCLSSIYGLCWVHRISVVYSMSVILGVVLRRHDFFETYNVDLYATRGVMFGLGVIICLLNIWKIRDNRCSKSSQS